MDVILSKLPDATRRKVEARMIKGYEYQSEFARKYYGQGKAEGRGDGLQEAVLTLAGARLPELSAEDRAAIGAIRDGASLTALILALSRAGDAAEARAALDAALQATRAS